MVVTANILGIDQQNYVRAIDIMVHVSLDRLLLFYTRLLYSINTPDNIIQSFPPNPRPPITSS